MYRSLTLFIFCFGFLLHLFNILIYCFAFFLHYINWKLFFWININWKLFFWLMLLLFLKTHLFLLFFYLNILIFFLIIIYFLFFHLLYIFLYWFSIFIFFLLINIFLRLPYLNKLSSTISLMIFKPMICLLRFSVHCSLHITKKRRSFLAYSIASPNMFSIKLDLVIKIMIDCNS